MLARAKWPPPAQTIARVGASSHDETKQAGLTSAGASNSRLASGNTPCVICVAAVGARQLTRMPYFSPSMRQRLHQADQRHLRGAVVGLAEVSVETGRRRGHDDAAVALLAHAVPDRLGADDGAHEMDVDHQPKVIEAHLCEALVAQDAGVVDEDVDAPPVRRACGYHRGDRGLVGHRRARTRFATPPDAGFLRQRRSAASRATSLTTTRAPLRARNSACSRPSPPPAPVTIATRSRWNASLALRRLGGQRRGHDADIPVPRDVAGGAASAHDPLDELVHAWEQVRLRSRFVFERHVELIRAVRRPLRFVCGRRYALLRECRPNSRSSHRRALFRPELRGRPATAVVSWRPCRRHMEAHSRGTRAAPRTRQLDSRDRSSRGTTVRLPPSAWRPVARRSSHTSRRALSRACSLECCWTDSARGTRPPDRGSACESPSRRSPRRQAPAAAGNEANGSRRY